MLIRFLMTFYLESHASLWKRQITACYILLNQTLDVRLPRRLGFIFIRHLFVQLSIEAKRLYKRLDISTGSFEVQIIAVSFA